MTVSFLDSWVPNGPFPIVFSNDVGGGDRTAEWDSTVYPTISEFLDAYITLATVEPGVVVKVRELSTQQVTSWVRVNDEFNTQAWGLSGTGAGLTNYVDVDAGAGFTYLVDMAGAGLTGLTEDLIGASIELSGCSNTALNGIPLVVVDLVSSTKISLKVPDGLVFAGTAPSNTEANNGSISWKILQRRTGLQINGPTAGLTDAGASVDALSGNEATITGLFGMTADSVGRTLKLGAVDYGYASDPGTAANAGYFVITEYISATSVKIKNPLADTGDANNGQIGWAELTAWSPVQNGTDMGIVAGCELTNPTTINIALDAGVICVNGRKYGASAAALAWTTQLTSDQFFYVAFDTLLGKFTLNPVANRTSRFFPVAKTGYKSAGTINSTKLYHYTPYIPAYVPNAAGKILVGSSGAHFSWIGLAIDWLYAVNETKPQNIEVVTDIDLSTTQESGSVSVSGTTATGTATRFLRDFSVGDYIKIGSVWAVIATIPSDTSLTMVVWTGGTVSGQTHYSARWFGEHNYMSSATAMASLALTVTGQLPVPTALKPVISYGVVDPTPEPVPIFTNTEYLSVKDIDFVYNGGAGVAGSMIFTSSNTAYLSFENCDIDLGTLDAFQNGLSASNSTRFIYKKCNFTGLDQGTGYFYLLDSGAQFYAEDCTFTGGTLDCYYVWRSTDTSSTGGSAVFERCSFVDIERAVFFHNVTPAKHFKKISNCYFKALATGAKISITATSGSVDSGRVDVSGCRFEDGWDLHGAGGVVGCTNVDAGAVTMTSASSVVSGSTLVLTPATALAHTITSDVRMDDTAKGRTVEVSFMFFATASASPATLFSFPIPGIGILGGASVHVELMGTANNSNTRHRQCEINHFNLNSGSAAGPTIVSRTGTADNSGTFALDWDINSSNIRIRQPNSLTLAAVDLDVYWAGRVTIVLTSTSGAIW